LLAVRLLEYARSKFVSSPAILGNFVDCSSHHENSSDITGISTTIIIPTRDQPGFLFACVDSIITLTEGNYEIIVVDNGSVLASTLALLDQLRERGVKVLQYNQPFNFSAICNLAARQSSSDILCFLNDDTVVKQKDWLTNLVSHATQKDTGVVGAMLLYPDQRIQHVGIALGYDGIAGLPFSGELLTMDIRKQFETCFQVSAVAFACAVVSREAYWEIGGLDESYAVGINDVVFGVSALALGKKNICCGRTVLEHVEYGSRPSMWSLKGASQAVIEVLNYLSSQTLPRIKEHYFTWEVSRQKGRSNFSSDL